MPSASVAPVGALLAAAVAHQHHAVVQLSRLPHALQAAGEGISRQGHEFDICNGGQPLLLLGAWWAPVLHLQATVQRGVVNAATARGAHLGIVVDP